MKTFVNSINLLFPNKKNLFPLISLAIIDSSCNIVLPLSFAQITSNAIIQNFNLAKLWLAINLLISILKLSIKHVANSLVKRLNSNNLDFYLEVYNTTIAESIINLTEPIYKYFCTLILVIELVIVSAFISLKLSIFILASIIIFAGTKHLIDKLTNFSFNSHSIIEFLWLIITGVLILATIYDLNSQLLSLNGFLVVIAFINNHLLKSYQTTNIKTKIKEVVLNIEKYQLDV